LKTLYEKDRKNFGKKKNLLNSIQLTRKQIAREMKMRNPMSVI